MTESIKDHVVRSEALTPERSFIIQAPAGSGKTGLLIKRYLKLLSLVDEPEEIVAITFTRKAAAEMQQRILQALLDAQIKSETTSEHEKETRELALAALQRDVDRSWGITGNPGRLRIQTIDALCASLTRQMPLLARLGTQPEIVEDARPLFEQAAINTLAELESGEGWSDAIADLVFHLDNDLPRIKRLLVDMLMKRDQWLAYVIHEHNREDMEQALVSVIDAQLQTLSEYWPSHLHNDCLELLRFAADNLAVDKPEHRLCACRELDMFPTATAEHLHQWQAIRELFMTTRHEWRSPKGLNKNAGFPSPNEKQLDHETSERRQQMKVLMQEVLSELQDVPGLQSVLKMVSLLPSSSYTDDEWRTVNALCELLKLAALQLWQVFADRNQIDFIGIAGSAIEALGDDEHPTELARHLDYQVKHLLVDEFQDVSINQARLIKTLTREWSLDDNRSLFLVGDPMQSIYRFREADVSVFIKTFHEARLGHIPLSALKLSVNFRSQQALIAWVNACFKQVFPAQDNISAGAVAYSQAEAFDISPADNNVRIYPLYGNSFQQEASKVSTIVDEIAATYPRDSIAILVRGRRHLADVIPALRESGHRFKAVEIEHLARQPAIQDLLALTRAWLFPADRVAWLACLRAPWCGLTLESLYQLTHADRERLVLHCLQDETLLEGLNEEQHLRATRFISIFMQCWQHRQRDSIRNAIESLWCQLGGPATLHDQTELENCDTYLALLDNLERGGTLDDIDDLMEKVGELFAAADTLADNRIQVMTIHKAKGLEFDHVILPGLGRQPRNRQDELLAWLQQEHENHDDLVLAPIRQAGEDPSPIYTWISEQQKQKQRYEDQRLLYVASTRSKKTLHLLGHANIKRKDSDVRCEAAARSLLSWLWHSVRHVYEQHMPDETLLQTQETIVQFDQHNERLPINWQSPDIMEDTRPAEVYVDEDIPPGGIEYEWAGETIKNVGSVVHRVLQWIAEEGLSGWDIDRVDRERPVFSRMLLQLGVPAGEELDNALHKVSAAIRNILVDERGRWLLNDGYPFRANEYDIGGMIDGRLTRARIDRTFVDKQGVCWIIDYKTGSHEGTDIDAFLDREQERYAAQLEKYGVLMKQLGHGNVRLALYYPLLQGWREWPLN